MIPTFNKRGELPSGIHEASLSEIDQALAFSSRRLGLMNGLRSALENLRGAGVRRVYINGSFTSDKADPQDIDGCWDADESVNVDELDPVFLDFSNRRQAMKEKYGVDFFIAAAVELGSGMPFKEFFQFSRDGLRKGILVVDLVHEENSG